MSKEFMLIDTSGRGFASLADETTLLNIYDSRTEWCDIEEQYVPLKDRLTDMEVGDEWFDQDDNIRILRTR